ncbi:carboxylesterase/lipase family protein [Nocardia sp. NPDC101769]|uniref:carboxylesterase/lipase family protein n=1 Tax=Nocardia sp. NPDC101769 TaxID=3364333 RepID=UPI0038269A59
MGTDRTSGTAEGLPVGRRRFFGLAGAGVAALTATAACSSGGGSAGGDQPLVATTRQGKVRGVQVADGVLVWKGIPFAAPPTGNLRFAPPQPAQAWSGIRDATQFGHGGLQPPSKADLAAPVADQSEDCLYLNVWSRATSGKRPVIVWIHGGGFVSGQGADPLYDGSHYAARDCVLVTINYRLGAFGGLVLPGKPGSGNLRLLDQMAALRWVRDNIAGFGGDPANVTVAGESAGAMSIGPMLGIADARKLFHRAILASGGPRPMRTPEFMAATTNSVLHTLGISDPAKLTDVPAEDLLHASTAANIDPQVLDPYANVIDGVVFTDHPLKTVNGSVDLMIGTCAREADSFAAISPLFGSRTETLLRQAVGDQLWDHLQQVYSDTPLPGHDPRTDVFSSWFAQMPSVWLAEHAQAAGAKVWQYTFDYPAAIPMGPIHSSDVPYTFGNLDHVKLSDPATAQRLSATMVASFTAFAHTGNPQTPDLPDWPSFTPDKRTCLSFDAQPQLIDDRLPAARREAWAEADPYRVC